MKDDEQELRELLARAQPVVLWAKARIRGEGTDDETIRRQRGSMPATPENLERLSRRLPGAANRGGRSAEAAGRVADYRAAILALAAEKHYREGEITARRVLDRLHRSSPAQLWKDVSDPDIGGWKRFRAEVLRSR